MIKQPKLWAIAAVIALAQSSVLGWMIWDRASLLKSGREIVLPVVPVDPRSLFRGDYVILSYEISNLPAALLPADLKLKSGQPLYVVIEPAGKGWKPVAVSLARPATLPPGQLALAARSSFAVDVAARRPQGLRVSYGIESYFVPEKTGRSLEDKARERTLEVVVAVGKDGRTQIKGLVIDGERRIDEQLL